MRKTVLPVKRCKVKPNLFPGSQPLITAEVTGLVYPFHLSTSLRILNQ